MQISVIGLWHLGSVTAACLSKVGYDVLAFDPDEGVIEQLKNGSAPIFEPHLNELLNEAVANKKLHYTHHIADISNSDIIYITFDTAVDNNDHADVNAFILQIKKLEPYIKDRALMLISSQIPVGTTKALQENFSNTKNVCFAYLPENLRLGQAIDVFMNPDRIVIGLDNQNYKPQIESLLKPFSDNLIWMSVASAEMTKHAINSFLALSVTFINEIASLCETVGASAHDVEKGLKSENRIGKKAYLRPGDAIAGGTLMRDVNYLTQLGVKNKQNLNLISSIIDSNRCHQQWARKKLQTIYSDLSGKNIAMLGLTYKTETNTLKRSSAIETCEWLSKQGCKIFAYDPSIEELPSEFSQFIQMKDSYQKAITNSDAIIISTAWPEFQNLTSDEILRDQNKPVILLDPNGCIAKNMMNHSQVKYYSVGYAS